MNIFIKERGRGDNKTNPIWTSPIKILNFKSTLLYGHPIYDLIFLIVECHNLRLQNSEVKTTLSHSVRNKSISWQYLRVTRTIKNNVS